MHSSAGLEQAQSAARRSSPGSLPAAHLEVVSAPDDAIKGHAVVGLLSTAELQEGKALVAVHVAAGDAGASAQPGAHCSR